MTEKDLEDKANNLLADPSIEPIDVKFSSTVFYFSLLIIYKER